MEQVQFIGGPKDGECIELESFPLVWNLRAPIGVSALDYNASARVSEHGESVLHEYALCRRLKDGYRYEYMGYRQDP